MCTGSRQVRGFEEFFLLFAMKISRRRKVEEKVVFFPVQETLRVIFRILKERKKSFFVSLVLRGLNLLVAGAFSRRICVFVKFLNEKSRKAFDIPLLPLSPLSLGPKQNRRNHLASLT